jgi:uncharacterized protein involved in tolerance to divalent cations
VMKTTRNRLADLQKEVQRLHSYEIPKSGTHGSHRKVTHTIAPGRGPR